jgi:hypothetical protein
MQNHNLVGGMHNLDVAAITALQVHGQSSGQGQMVVITTERLRTVSDQMPLQKRVGLFNKCLLDHNTCGISQHPT